jgi:DNA-directed RNA polymerase III subunit RPC11
MLFCPLDGTLLQVRQGANSHFYCATCPYSSSITAPQTMKMFPKRKVVDDILGGAAAWENVDRTMAVCPACDHKEAYFLQIQIRSADEPMSIFYRCVKCDHQWNDK